MLKIRLVSDFLDYYDHWFDLEGHIFERVAHKGMSRRAALEYMSSLGFDVPIFGTVKELSQKEGEYVDFSLEVYPEDAWVTFLSQVEK